MTRSSCTSYANEHLAAASMPAGTDTPGAEVDPERSWNAVVETYGAALQRVVASYVPAGASRKDLSQEVALAVWRALPKFRGESSERTYIFRIAHNVCLRQVTRDRRMKTEELEEMTLASGDDSAEQVVEKGQRSTQLWAAVRRLPLSQRQALTLALEGLSHAEIGATLGIAENAVAVRIHRAKQRLATLMEAA